MKRIVLIFLFYVSLVNAQSYKLGFDLEPHQIRVSDHEGTQILGGNGLPLSIHFVLTYNPTKEFILLAKIGRSLHEEFRGWEYGISGKYNFYKGFYLLVGLLQHSNEGGSSSNSQGINYASILMLHGGIGFDFSKVTSIQINYYVPTSKKIIGWSRGFDSRGEWTNFSYTFENMITLNFIFAWEL